MSQIYKQRLYPQSVTFLQYCFLFLVYVVFALFSLFHVIQFRFAFDYFDSIVGHADFLGFLRLKTFHSQINDMHVPLWKKIFFVTLFDSILTFYKHVTEVNHNIVWYS